jgi:hypothetical protein
MREWISPPVMITGTSLSDQRDGMAELEIGQRVLTGTARNQSRNKPLRMLVTT